MGSGGLRKVSAPSRGYLWLLVLAGLASALLVARNEEPAPSKEPPATYRVAAEGEEERTHASANFAVTWIHDSASPDAPSLRDKDGDGVPDSVQDVLSAFESARSFLLGDLGYRQPPTSGPTRIYVAGIEGPPNTKLGPGDARSRTSFFVIPASRLRPPDSPRQLRLMAVHEYFHAIQHGYDSDEEHWIREATATWVQDVFDDRADSTHHLLRSFVPSPRRSLTDVTGDNEYGAFLFVEFLVERFADGDPDLVRELWQEMAIPEAGGKDRGALDAIEAVLARRGSSLRAAWTEFLLWRWDLDRFEEGESYAKLLGGQWPKPLQTTEVDDESCRLSTDAGSGLPPLSGDYSVFRPAEKPASARATVTMEGPPNAMGFALVQSKSGKEKVQMLSIGGDGLASARVRFGGDEVKRVVLGVANTAPAGPPASVGYSLKMLGRGAVTVEPVSPPAETHYFGGLTLRGRVLCNGQPAALADVRLVQDKRSGEQRVFDLDTVPGGLWFRTFEPDETSTYHVEVADPLLSPATSPSWDVAVRVVVRLEVPDPEVPMGEPLTVEGSLTPSHPGAVVLIEYRRPDLSWRAGPQTTAGGDGTYRTEVTLPGQGIWHLRATVLSTGDGDHIGSSTVQDIFVNVT